MNKNKESQLFYFDYELMVGYLFYNLTEHKACKNSFQLSNQFASNYRLLKVELGKGFIIIKWIVRPCKTIMFIFFLI